MVIGLGLSVLIMTALLSLFNYFIMLPFYNALMNIPTDTTILKKTILSAIIPFNLLKGIIISLIFALVFSKMGVWINKQIPSRNV
ncbi:hypothetical protein A499_12621 [Niallia nealsonii AAU1]|nr:hypothetical protein A499_12621 [Niallia nealsonii AAU1]